MESHNKWHAENWQGFCIGGQINLRGYGDHSYRKTKILGPIHQQLSLLQQPLIPPPLEQSGHLLHFQIFVFSSVFPGHHPPLSHNGEIFLETLHPKKYLIWHRLLYKCIKSFKREHVLCISISAPLASCKTKVGTLSSTLVKNSRKYEIFGAMGRHHQKRNVYFQALRIT